MDAVNKAYDASDKDESTLKVCSSVVVYLVSMLCMLHSPYSLSTPFIHL